MDIWVFRYISDIISHADECKRLRIHNTERFVVHTLIAFYMPYLRLINLYKYIRKSVLFSVYCTLLLLLLLHTSLQCIESVRVWCVQTQYIEYFALYRILNSKLHNSHTRVI